MGRSWNASLEASWLVLRVLKEKVPIRNQSGCQCFRDYKYKWDLKAEYVCQLRVLARSSRVLVEY